MFQDAKVHETWEFKSWNVKGRFQSPCNSARPTKAPFIICSCCLTCLRADPASHHVSRPFDMNGRWQTSCWAARTIEGTSFIQTPKDRRSTWCNSWSETPNCEISWVNVCTMPMIAAKRSIQWHFCATGVASMDRHQHVQLDICRVEKGRADCLAPGQRIW